MADVSLDSGGGGRGRSRKRSNKVSTKIDMTPMVDLAFLLLTFFMLTTTFSKPQAMNVHVPDKTKDNKTQDIKESKALTIILGEKNKIYWFQGVQNPDVKTTDFSPNGVRKLLNQKKAEVKDLVIIIKATEKSKYRNMVDILDEMHITESKRYAIAKVTPHDLELIKNL